MSRIYRKKGTNSVLLVNNRVALSSRCCCRTFVVTGSAGDPVTESQFIVYTATLSPLTSGLSPTGTVLWKLNGTTLNTFPNPTNMHANGTANTPQLYDGDQPGTLIYEADYSGDSNYAPKTASFTQHVQAPPQVHPYNVFFCGAGNPFPSGNPVSFQICAQTQAQSISCLNCSPACVDTTVNGVLPIQIYGTSNVTVTAPSSVTLVNGTATLTLTVHPSAPFGQFCVRSPNTTIDSGCCYSVS